MNLEAIGSSKSLNKYSKKFGDVLGIKIPRTKPSLKMKFVLSRLQDLPFKKINKALKTTKRKTYRRGFRDGVRAILEDQFKEGIVTEDSLDSDGDRYIETSIIIGKTPKHYKNIEGKIMKILQKEVPVDLEEIFDSIR